MADVVKVAFLGTGLMGYPMVLNLAAAEFAVHAWNRSSAKTEGLSGHGVAVHPDLADALRDCDVAVSMVSDGSVTQSLIEQSIAAGVVDAGTIWIDMSSTRPEEARLCEKMLSKRNARFVDAPVSGGTKGAIAGNLAIMAGGHPEVFERVAPVLRAMGTPVLVGPVGSGQLAKLANQMIVGVTISVVAEAILLLERGGADPGAVRQALMGGFADSPILQNHGGRMTERDFEPGGKSSIQLKDLNNALSEADALGIRLPVLEHVRQRYERYVQELDGADRDHAGLFEELLEMNGLL